jgi:hypothetical protein
MNKMKQIFMYDKLFIIYNKDTRRIKGVRYKFIGPDVAIFVGYINIGMQLYE